MVSVSLVTVACLCALKATYAGYGYSSGNSRGTSPKKYKVTALVTPPFINAPDDNGNITGIFVDVLNVFKGDGDFDYSLSLSETELYGDGFPNGSSNGMINEVVTGVADIAVGALTATGSRHAVVDFTNFIFISLYRIAINKDYNPDTAQYFIRNSTSLQTYLSKNTFNPLVVKIWASIQKDPANNIVTSYADGIQKVAAGGNVAFVADTPGVLLEQQKHKDTVTFTGDNLSYTWFTMAVKIDSPLRRILNDKILEIYEDGDRDAIASKLPSPCLS